MTRACRLEVDEMFFLSLKKSSSKLTSFREHYEFRIKFEYFFVEFVEIFVKLDEVFVEFSAMFVKCCEMCDFCLTNILLYWRDARRMFRNIRKWIRCFVKSEYVFDKIDEASSKFICWFVEFDEHIVELCEEIVNI